MEVTEAELVRLCLVGLLFVLIDELFVSLLALGRDVNRRRCRPSSDIMRPSILCNANPSTNPAYDP